MFNGFWSGIFGGFIAPMVAPLLRRYGYRAIFITAVFGTYLFIFVPGIWRDGWHASLPRIIQFILTSVGIFLPIGVGLAAVVVVLINVPGEIGGNSKQTETTESHSSLADKFSDWDTHQMKPKSRDSLTSKATPGKTGSECTSSREDQ